jgi:hypothetical protein
MKSMRQPSAHQFAGWLMRRRYVVLPVVGGLIGISLIGLWASFTHEKWIEQLLSLISGVTSTFLALLLGLKQIERIIERQSRRNALRDVGEFWQTQSNSPRFYILFGGRASAPSDDIEVRVQFATAYSFATLSSMLGDLYEGAAHLEFRPARLYDATAMRNLIDSDNVVILGGDISVPFTDEVLSELSAPYRQNCKAAPREIFRSENGARSEVHFSQVVDSVIQKDVALVTRFLHPKTRNLLVFISGNFGVGTIGSTLALTKPSEFPSAGFDRDASAQQCIIEVGGVGTDNLVYRDTARISATKWTSFSGHPSDKAVSK